ncbi:MAG: TIGR01440 family protein [Ruminococcaceae bacterium]|nr:TIGR01440 family protein [Oscillospiraceae bacterium]
MNDKYKGADATVCKESLDAIVDEIRIALKDIFKCLNLNKGDIFVIGCSSSEIIGNKIGKGSSYETAKAIFDVIYPEFHNRGIYIAAQCCEHLNRALVIEKECADRYGYEPVSVIPQPKAGGSFATLAFESFSCPVVVEKIRAHAGMDIGDTLIGMHLRDVAVPIRLSIRKIGGANLVCAYTRPKYIGGSRAVY